MSIYCIGDVHGCVKSLEALLTKLNYCESSDELWFTGDLINRGPSSIAVLDLVRSLPKTSCVMGNHELATISCHFHRQFIAKLRHPERMQRILNDLTSAHLEWLLQRPLLHEAILVSGRKAFLAHAGVYPLWNFEMAQRYAKEALSALQQNPPSALSAMFGAPKITAFKPELSDLERFSFIDTAFLGMRYCLPDGTLELTTTKPPESNLDPELKPWFQFKRHEAQDSYQIIFGHWAALGARRCTKNSSVICVDSGCSWGKSLTAYDVVSDTFISVPCQDNLDLT